MSKNHILFLGYGSIAKAHAYAINALPYYYNDLQVSAHCIAGRNLSNASQFAKQYGFKNSCSIDEISSLDTIDTVFILGPNKVHIPHLKLALGMKNVTKIYIEKPLFCNNDEEIYIKNLIDKEPSNIQIQVGFQFLQSNQARRALQVLKQNDFGDLIHFRAQYLRCGYLDSNYRNSRGDRLKPTPEGGAVADLGSHVFSLLIALIGNQLEVLHAAQSKTFPNIHPLSDLCTQIMLKHKVSGAIGNITASRISAGSDDALEVELRFSNGALRFSSTEADMLQVYHPKQEAHWTSEHCGNDYAPHSQFPQQGIASGWLRALVHAHYVFLTQDDKEAFIPNLQHGLHVQQLINNTANILQQSL